MIIPVYRVVTSQFPIAATTSIEAGMVVTLNTSTGYAKVCATADFPIGLAADRNRAAESWEWVNRVTDMGNDTAASGMLSVYHGGGEFFVDVNDGAITTPGGSAISGVINNGLTVNPGTKLYTYTGGHMDTSSAGNATAVAVALTAEAVLDSGIPGEYAPGASVAYANDSTPRTWVKVKLLV